MSATVLGGLLTAFTNTTVLTAWGSFFSAPGKAIGQAWDVAFGTYWALFEGSVFNPHTVAALFQQASFSTAIHDGFLSAVFNPLSETAVQATPLILTGLAVALPYRAGLFNIGGQSQFIGGAIMAAWLGYAYNMPFFVHVVVCCVGAFVGGAALGWLAGEIKARTGAHEVIVTIMLNYVMQYFLAYLLSSHSLMQAPGGSNAITLPITSNAHLPLLAGTHLRINAGFLIALAAALAVWWLLNRTTTGFEFRSIGANARASRVAGMNVERNWTLVMTICGRARGPGRRLGHPRHRLHAQPAELRHLRDRRDHRGPARAGPAGRRGGGRAAVRRAARGIARHAGRDRHPGTDRAGHPGADRALRGGAAADPGHVPAPAGPGRRGSAPRCPRGGTRDDACFGRAAAGPARTGPARAIPPPRRFGGRFAAPITYAVFGLLNILVFGAHAHGDATLSFTPEFAKVTVPNLTLAAAATCYVVRRRLARAGRGPAARRARDHPPRAGLAAGDRRGRALPVHHRAAGLGRRRPVDPVQHRQPALGHARATPSRSCSAR